MNTYEPLLRRLAHKVLGNTKAKKIWSRIEIIGDIAVIRKPWEVSIKDMKIIGSELLKQLPYVRSVWCAISEVEGPYRIRKYIHLAGERRSETIYVEHGCKFKLDITKVYVSPTLNYEHRRIAEMVNPREVVINMFAGVGIFSIVIARKVSPVKVFSIDINPYAYKYMVENVEINKVENYVVPILGDAAKVIVKKLTYVADRVLMPLPELAISYLKYAILSLKSKGFLHTYLFVKAKSRKESLSRAEEIYSQELKRYVKDYELLSCRVVRSVGPRKYQVVLDYYVNNKK